MVSFWTFPKQVVIEIKKWNTPVKHFQSTPWSNTLVHQSIPSANIPLATPEFCTYFQSGSRGFVPSELPGDRIYYQSTKLSVDAAWRHFSATNWSTIYCCFLVTKSVSKLGENFKTSETRGHDQRIIGQPPNSFQGLISAKSQNFDAD